MNESPDQRAQHGDVDADGEIVDAATRLRYGPDDHCFWCRADGAHTELVLVAMGRNAEGFRCRDALVCMRRQQRQKVRRDIESAGLERHYYSRSGDRRHFERTRAA